MDFLICDFISRMGLALHVAILVGVRASRMIHQMNMETKIIDLEIDVVKEKILTN